MEPSPPGRHQLFERQGYHLLSFVLIGGLLLWGARSFPPARRAAWGLSALDWTVVSWLFAGWMQAFIWFFWRAELYFGWVSRTCGKAGFPIFQLGFSTWAAGRFLPLIPISLATARTAPLPQSWCMALLVVTTPAIVWTFYSFARYFGVGRAMGADHFDRSYRDRELETRGIFRYLRNPAYAVGLLILYHAGLLCQSALGLVVAAAHHAFVWVAYFCTEKPDMREIYGRKAGMPRDVPAA